MIDKFLNEVCKILEINPPQVSIGGNHFANTTMLAQCSSDGQHIFLRNKEANPDIFFSIAHELRHVWQIRSIPFTISFFPHRNYLNLHFSALISHSPCVIGTAFRV